MLGSFSRSPLQAHTRDPNGHSQVSPARGTTPYSHRRIHVYTETSVWYLIKLIICIQDSESSIGCTCDHLFSLRITLAQVVWSF